MVVVLGGGRRGERREVEVVEGGEVVEMEGEDMIEGTAVVVVVVRAGEAGEERGGCWCGSRRARRPGIREANIVGRVRVRGVGGGVGVS